MNFRDNKHCLDNLKYCEYTFLAIRVCYLKCTQKIHDVFRDNRQSKYYKDTCGKYNAIDFY